MRSHRYGIRGPFGTLAPVWMMAAFLAFVILLRMGEGLGWLPAADPGLDSDTAALHHQRMLAVSGIDADFVLFGDSSCMMGVDAIGLGDRLGTDVDAVNLGLIMGLGLETYADAVSEFLDRDPDGLRAVVLLVSPAKLSVQQRSPGFESLWAGLEGNSRPAASETGPVRGAARLFEQRLVRRVLPVPLSGSGQAFYGFTSGIRDYLRWHRGSAVDPGEFHWGRGGGFREAERHNYGLSEDLRDESEAAGRLLRGRAPLLVGLTPLPDVHVSGEFERERDAMLREWASWIGHGDVLTGLPAVLPGGLFATPTHLNARGQRLFTDRLALELERVVPRLDGDSAP